MSPWAPWDITCLRRGHQPQHIPKLFSSSTKYHTLPRVPPHPTPSRYVQHLPTSPTTSQTRPTTSHPAPPSTPRLVLPIPPGLVPEAAVPPHGLLTPECLIRFSRTVSLGNPLPELHRGVPPPSFPWRGTRGDSGMDPSTFIGAEERGMARSGDTAGDPGRSGAGAELSGGKAARGGNLGCQRRSGRVWMPAISNIPTGGQQRPKGRAQSRRQLGNLRGGWDGMGTGNGDGELR